VGTHDSGWSVSRGLLEVRVEMTAKTVVVGRLWSMALGLEMQGRVTHGFF